MGKLIISSAADLVACVDFLADMAVRSKFIKDLNKDQAKIFAYTSISKDVDLLDVMQAFDVLGTRLAKKSAAMLAEFKQRGGKYKILARTHERSAIEYNFEGQVATFELTWDQIKDEDYTKDRDGKNYKPRYKEPHSRMQMLWARLVSDSVRAVCPEATGGYYTPEETADIIDADGWRTVTPPAGNIAHQPATTTTSSVAEVASSPQPQVDVMISAEQQLELANLFTMLGITPAQVTASLAARGVQQLVELTAAQAAEIIAKLRSNLPKSEGQQQVQTTGPITQELEAKIQEAIKTCAQLEGGTAINQAIVDHLGKHSLMIHQLTYAEGQALLTAVEQRQVGLFLNLALNGHSGKA